MDKKNTKDCTKLTSGDLETILEVNKKAIEIHVEVEQQNENILEHLKYCREKIHDIDKAMFKLIVILSGLGLGVIYEFVQLILNFKH